MTKSEGESAERLFRAHLEHLAAGDLVRWNALWADDAVLEFPYAPDGFPERLEGRAAIVDYMSKAPESFSGWRFDDIDVRVVAGDHSTAVAQFKGSATIVRTGRLYNQVYVAEFTAREGLVTRYREYWDPIRVLEAFGGLEAMRAGFGDGSTIEETR